MFSLECGSGQTRDVAGRKDARRAGLQKAVHLDAAIEREADALRQLRTRPHPDADNDHIGLQYASALETDLVAFDPSRGFAEMEDAYGTSAQRKGVQLNRSRTMHFFCHESIRDRYGAEAQKSAF